MPGDLRSEASPNDTTITTIFLRILIFFAGYLFSLIPIWAYFIAMLLDMPC